MNQVRRLAVIGAMGIFGALSVASSASAATPQPAWSLSAHAVPTDFPPAGSGETYFSVAATNSGAAATDGTPIHLEYQLPEGIQFVRAELLLRTEGSSAADFGPTVCGSTEAGGVTTVECEITEGVVGAVEPATLIPGETRELIVYVTVPGSISGPLVSEAAVSGGGPIEARFPVRNEATAQPAASGLSFYRSELVDQAGAPVKEAGSHPYQYTTSFAVDTEPGPAGGAPFVPAGGDLRNIEIALPPGLVGDPTAVARCTSQAFNEQKTISFPGGGQAFRDNCPQDSVIGFARVSELEGKRSSIYVPLYDLVPPTGMPAQLGFTVANAPFLIDTRLRTGDDYGITAYLANVDQVKRVTATEVTLWGVPSDPGHDPLRGDCMKEAAVGEGGLSAGACPYVGESKPFLRMPTACGNALPLSLTFDTWLDSAYVPAGTAEVGPASGCERVTFAPSLEAQPTEHTVDSPTGLHVDLHVPQNEDPQGVGTSDLRDTVVKLPPGLTVNPSSADGLGACTPDQFGLTTPTGTIPIHTTAGAAECPDPAKIGTVAIDTPLLDHPIPGSVYLAQPYRNPFGTLLAIYVAADDPVSGIVVKLAGEVQIGAEGQLTATFAETPQLPFEDFRVDFFSGPEAPLKTQSLCGSYSTTSTLTPWSAPASGPPATVGSTSTLDSAPGGGNCPTSAGAVPNSPSFEAGSESPLAGAFSPFFLRLSRPDGTQQFSSLSVTPPPGLLGSLAGVPYCPEEALAAAAARSGEEERAASSCPAASQVGTVVVGAGAGPKPYYVAGKAYLAGPYKGAPLSLAIVTPAVAGPFDLGDVVVRSALRVDPRTTQITVVSDPIPTELKGIPLDVRSIAVKMDRPRFTLNPTSCEAMAVTGSVTTVESAKVPLSNRFQATGCRSLPFRPRLALRVFGKTGRNAKPRLRAVLRTKPGEANIRRAQVNLPHSLFLEQAHIGTVCTRAEFAAGGGNGEACPKRSVYGRAKAYSPLLDQPLQGPVYLRSSSHKLPDLVAALHGQIDVELDGKIDSGPNRGLRNTFEVVPDAPVSRFVLELRGGGKGLLVNSEELCSKHAKRRAIVRFTGQNGKVEASKPKVAVRCGARKKKPGGRKS